MAGCGFFRPKLPLSIRLNSKPIVPPPAYFISYPLLLLKKTRLFMAGNLSLGTSSLPKHMALGNEKAWLPPEPSQKTIFLAKHFRLLKRYQLLSF